MSGYCGGSVKQRRTQIEFNSYLGSRNARGDAFESFDGDLDEVAFFGNRLTEERVKAHFDAAAIPEPTSLALLALGGVMLLKRPRRRA